MLDEGTGPDKCPFCGCSDPARKTQPEVGSGEGDGAAR